MKRHNYRIRGWSEQKSASVSCLDCGMAIYEYNDDSPTFGGIEVVRSAISAPCGTMMPYLGFDNLRGGFSYRVNERAIKETHRVFMDLNR